MALFPAYVAETAQQISETTDAGADPNEDEILLEVAGDKENGDGGRFYDEIELLRSDSSTASLSEGEKDSRSADDVENNGAKKRKRPKRSREEKHRKRAKILQGETLTPGENSEFYVDRKHDYGNLHVSTLYAPGRPRYNRIATVLGGIKWNASYKPRKIKRYFNMKIDQDSESIKVILLGNQHWKSDDNPEKLRNIEKIADSGIRWDDSRIDEDLVRQTEYFNKCLNDDPNDIAMWIRFINFQEDRYTFDVCNDRASSESSARSILLTKQLAIIDKCLERNPHNETILKLKVKISERSLPNDQYLALLKRMVSESGMPGDQLCGLWVRYIEAVQCSMALCSVPCVKDMYVGAVKALSKAHLQHYQALHVELMYPFGLFMRQSGLWEQLWLFLKLSIQTNVAVSATAAAEADLCFARLPPDDESQRENRMLKRETEIIGSGLPLHAVWRRCVRAREAEHWRPAPESSALPLDPQRLAYPSDLIDLLEPVTRPHLLFKLAINSIRSLKVPILPMTDGIQDILNVHTGGVEWEVDAVEHLLGFVYSIIEDPRPGTDCELKAIAKIMLDFVEQPTYFDDTNGFLTFVNKVMTSCTNWFSGEEKTALLVWWMRFQRVLLALNRSNESEGARVLKQAQKTLKNNRGNVLLYAEFAALEADLKNGERAIQILQSTFAFAKADSGQAHLCRSLVKLLLRNDRVGAHAEHSKKAVNVLMALANEKPLPKDLGSSYTDNELDAAHQQFADKTDTLLMRLRNDNSEVELSELMMPSRCADWLCCHGWFLRLTRPGSSVEQFHRKITLATDTDDIPPLSPAYRRFRRVREDFMSWYTTVSSLEANIFSSDCLEQFPGNATMVWWQVSHRTRRTPTARWQLFRLAKNASKSQLLLALAMVFSDFIRLYEKDDPSCEGLWQSGYSNRLHHLLQTLTKDDRYRRCALLWKLRIYFDVLHSDLSQTSIKNTLYLALDECPWNKDIYSIGCSHLPSAFSELIDLMVEKQLRLHAMPEELEPL